MVDDTVHPRNAMLLLTALASAGTDVAFPLDQPGRHGAAYNAVSARSMRQVTDQWLARDREGDDAPRASGATGGGAR